MTKPKVYTIKHTRMLAGTERTQTGTLAELTHYHKYTLECGKAYERERGNTKISLSPRTGESLATNLNRAVNNSSRIGVAHSFFELVA